MNLSTHQTIKSIQFTTVVKGSDVPFAVELPQNLVEKCWAKNHFN
jgi:hypothetical protein